MVDDDNDHLPVAPNYDPRVDYDELAWEAFCEEHENDPFVEGLKKTIKDIDN